VPRHRGDAAARQFGLDARSPDHGGGDLRRHPGAHARALRRQGRDPRLHHARLEGRSIARSLARRRQARQSRPPQRPAPYHLQGGGLALAARAQESRADDARGPAQGEYRRRGARLGAQAAAGAHRAAPDPDDDLRRRAGRRFHALGQSRQLPRAASALGDRGHRDALAGRIDRHRHRSRRHALLSPRGDHRRRRGAGRCHDREARRAVRRADPDRAAPGTEARRVTDPASSRRLLATPPSRRGAAVLLAAALLVAALPGAARAPLAEPPVAITVEAQPFAAFDVRDRTRRQFGRLEFRGGLVLRSAYRHFGGISAIRVAADGARFIALSDQGWWFRGRIVYDGTRPTGIADAEMAPILGADGRPLAEHGWYDTESIAEDGGTLYVGIERVHQIVRFDFGKDGLLARGRPIPVPPAVRTLPRNKGLEALVFVPAGLPLAGTLIAFSD